jgi:hypothetical protein
MIDGGLKEYGCYFLSIARLVELQEGREFSAKDMTAYWNGARLKGIVNAEMEITDAAKAYNLFAGRTVYKDVKKTATKPAAEAFFIRLEKPGYAHYVLSWRGDAWDSLDPGRPAAKAYKPAGYRTLA